MKKYLLTLLCFFSLTCMAQEIPVNLEGDPPENPNEPHRSIVQLPELTYEDNCLYVYSPYYIESMTVLVKDATGSVIYIYTAPMIAGKNTIVLPAVVSEEKYSVELLFGDWHLTGYF